MFEADYIGKPGVECQIKDGEELKWVEATVLQRNPTGTVKVELKDNTESSTNVHRSALRLADKEKKKLAFLGPLGSGKSTSFKALYIILQRCFRILRNLQSQGALKACNEASTEA